MAKWYQDAEWYGNRKLGYNSWHKYFHNPLQNNRLVKVHVFGKDDRWNFVVRAGKNSDFSYTGGIPDAHRLTPEAAMAYVDSLALTDKLFH